MARAYASIILKAPVETVWSLIRDLNALPKWAPGIVKSKIEGGRRTMRSGSRSVLGVRALLSGASQTSAGDWVVRSW